jgi:hypothetical protein
MHSKPGDPLSRGLFDLQGRYLLAFASWVFPTLAAPAHKAEGFGEEVFRLPVATFPEAEGLRTPRTTLCLNPAYIWQLLYLGASADCVLVYIYHALTHGSDRRDDV